MPDKDVNQNSDADAPPVDYAFWDVPGTSLKVIYSLPLFHEIDFVVNEGYRKIPHGGIEVGGVLFGTIEERAIRIEAFRPIDCEHASGPSIHFSERDLAELKKQISAAASDHELQKFQPVGWFLAHTRSPMELTESEASQFDEFFPEPYRVTTLVKPERFQPTRFGFLVRQADGRIPRDATPLAIILPLPGRSHKAGQLIPSLTAPAPTSSAKRAVLKEESRARVLPDLEVDEVEDSKPVAAPPPASSMGANKTPPEPLSIWKVPPEEDESDVDDLRGDLHADEAEREEALRSPAERAARRQLSRDRARVIEQAFPPPATFRPAPLPILPANAALPVTPGFATGAQRMAEEIPQVALAESVINARSLTVLAVAALLGCLVGYIAYLQLPAPVIPIDVRASKQTVVVSWPPDETRNAIYAAIRVNDGPPVPLSSDEKKLGQVSLTAARDFKVEVMARNWIRDSRGIVHYLRLANTEGQVVPSPIP